MSIYAYKNGSKNHTLTKLSSDSMICIFENQPSVYCMKDKQSHRIVAGGLYSVEDTKLEESSIHISWIYAHISTYMSTTDRENVTGQSRTKIRDRTKSNTAGALRRSRWRQVGRV